MCPPSQLRIYPLDQTSRHSLWKAWQILSGVMVRMTYCPISMIVGPPSFFPLLKNASLYSGRQVFSSGRQSETQPKAEQGTSTGKEKNEELRKKKKASLGSVICKSIGHVRPEHSWSARDLSYSNQRALPPRRRLTGKFASPIVRSLLSSNVD